MISFSVQLPHDRVRVTLYRRKSTAPFYARWWRDGEQHHRSTKAWDEKVARAEARKLVENCTTARGEANTSALVEEYKATRWPTPEVRDSTFKDHAHRLATFLTSLKDEHFTACDTREATALIQSHLDRRGGLGMAPQSLVNDQRVVSRFCSWLMHRRLTIWHVNPATKSLLDMPRVERRIKPHLSDAELRKFLKAAQPELKPIIVLCAGAGLRARGALRLKWSNIDTKRRLLRVFEKSRERVVPLSPWVCAQLKPGEPDTPIWPFGHKVVFHHAARAAKRAGVPAATLQACRRTFLWKLFKANVSPQLAAKLAGNSIQVIAAHYVNLAALDASKAVLHVDFSPTADKKRDKKNRKHRAV